MCFSSSEPESLDTIYFSWFTWLKQFHIEAEIYNSSLYKQVKTNSMLENYQKVQDWNATKEGLSQW